MGYASCKPADALVCVVPDGCLLALVSLLLAKRLAGKNVSKMTCFVLSGRKNQVKVCVIAPSDYSQPCYIVSLLLRNITFLFLLF